MKKIILPILTGLMFVGCTRDDINSDPNSAYTALPTTLISYSQKALSDHVTTPNYNTNVFRLTMQYWNEAIYMQESQYDFASRSVSDQIYSDNYVLVLNNLLKAKELINAYVPTATETTWPKIKANQLAIVDMMMVYTFQNLVDTFGNVPYSEALQLATISTPKYDDASTIYSDLISRLDADINALDVATTSSLGTADIYYAGNVTKWKKFGSSVLLKLGIALADVNPSLAQSTVNKAIGYGVITTNADNCIFTYLAASPNFNPLYQNLVVEGRQDFVAGKPIVDYMLASNDARVSKYFAKSENGDYKGSAIGLSASAQGGVNTLSLPGTYAMTATTPGILLNATEVNFYLAEAAARWGTGDPATLYATAVTTSFEQWGLTASDATAYLVTKPYDASNWKKSIGEQAWVALYNQPYTSWNTWRRLDYPQLTPAANAAPVSEGKIPVRMVYSTRENSTNGASVAAAATAVGGDKLTTKIFWDKN